jgi:hypothetical protein
MRHHLAPLAVSAALAFCSLASAAETDHQQERIDSSFVLALGRLPSSQERADFSALGAVPVSDLVARHQAHLQSDPAFYRITKEKAFTDAFGREPNTGELDAEGIPMAYTQLMKSHIQWLADHPDEYHQVIERAYRKVIRRSVYAAENAYWHSQDTLPYTLLVGCLEDWSHRNSPGLMETTGIATVSVNCRFLTTAILSPSVAAETRSALGLVSRESPDLAGASGHTLVGAGAERIRSTGHIHFVAAGADDLVPHSRS